MYKKRTPRIEFTAYLSSSNASKPIDPDTPITSLPLESFTLKALTEAGIETIGGALDLLAKADSDVAVDLPKGIGKRRLKEIEAAINAHPTPDATPEPVAAIIFGALETVARRCGTGALYHSGEILDHDCRPVLRLRWAAGAEWRSLVRRVKRADKHFHACQLRHLGPDPITEILE